MASRFNKLIYLTLGLTLLSLASWAQTFPLQIQVSVMPPYSAYLQDYPGTGQQVRVFIINTSRTTYQIRLTGQLTGDNGIEIRTSPNYRPPRPVTVPPGQTLLTRNDLEGLFDLSQIEVTGIDKNLLARGFPLPDGTYQLCVRAYNETATNTAAVAFGQPLSAEFPIGCSAPLIIRSVEPPILISPLCDAEVTATNPQAVVFTWTPPAGVSPASVEYILRVVELPQVDVDPNVYIDAVVLPRSGVEVRGLRTSTFLYGPTQPPLTVGKRYAWRVQAIDRSRRLNFLNDGKAPVCAFTYGTGLPALAKQPGLELVQKPTVLLPIAGLTPGVDTPPAGATAMMYKSGPITGTCSCTQTLPADVAVDNTNAMKQKSATIAGGFPLTFLEDVKEDPDQHTLSGTAMVPMPIVNSSYAKVRCRLIDVQCNAAGQVISGFVQAIQTNKEGPWPTYTKPDIMPKPLSSDQISQVGQYWTSYQEGVVSQANNTKQSVGWEVPFGIQKSVGSFGGVFTVTDLLFTPSDAYFNANMWISVPEVAKFKGIPLSASHVCIKWNGTGAETCGDKVLYLADNVEIGAGSQLILSLKGGSEGDGGPNLENATHVRYNENGFDQMHVVAGLTSPALKIATGSDKGKPLEMLTQFDVKNPDFTNWTAQVSTPNDFYVVGLSDFVLSMKDANGKVQPATYDHDDDANPGLLPSDYDPGKTPTWHGLFLPQLTITVPFLKSLNNGKNVSMGVQNMVYDANGFTGDAFAGDETNPLVALGDGNLASWYCSADQFKISFRQSDFQSSSLTGRVVLPIFKYADNMDQSAVWPYSCKLTKGTDGMQYQFLIAPKENVQANVWRASLKLNKDLTNIIVSNKSGGFVAEANLDGEFSINTGTFLAPGVRFKGLMLTTQDPYINVDGFATKFASPQKDLAGLPFNLSNVGLAKAAGKAGQFDFSFTGSIELAEATSLTATTSARVRFTAGLEKGRPNWEYNDFLVDHISGEGHAGAISAKVDLDFYHDQVKYGNGFNGTATLSLGFIGGLGVQARFGRTVGNAGFRYWYVGGTAILPAGGIPMTPTPIAFKGFGGGVFSRMTRVTTNKGEVDYDPDPTVKFGVKADVIMGTYGSNLLNVDGSLTMEFGENYAPTLIAIHGDGYLLASDPPNYGSALAKGTIDLSYDLAHDVFEGKGGLTASYGTSKFKIEAVARDVGFRIKPSKGQWFFSLGTPNERLDLNIYIASKDPVFTFGSYLLTGNDLPVDVGKIPPTPYGLSAKTINDLNYVAQDITPLIASKAPLLAFGAGYKADASYNVGPFFLDFNGALGYDLAMYNTDQACNGSLPGVNGWYATGQFYAYLKFALGIDVDLWVYSGRITAVELEAGALLQGGAVNPIWFHGNVFLRYKVLNGLVKGKMNMDFWYNKDGQCKPAYTPPNPFADQPLIARLGPSTKANESVSILTPLYAEFNYPVNSEMTIDAITPEGKMLHRRFRIVFKSGESFETGLARKSGPGGYEQCALDNTGRIKYGKEGSDDEGDTYTATFYRTSAMAPTSQYDLNLGVEVLHEYTPDDNDADYKSGWHTYRYKKVNVDQSEKVAFGTGECLTGLTRDGGDNATVLFSYPFEGQRYFMRSDGSKFGVIMLTAKMCCMNNLSSDKYFSLKVRMTPYANGAFSSTKAGGALYADAKFIDNNRAQYVVPDGIKASTLYTLDLVRVPTQLYINEQQSLEQQAKQKAIAATKQNKFLGMLGSTASMGIKTDVGSSINQSPGPAPSDIVAASGQTVGVSLNNAASVGANPIMAQVNAKATSLTEEEYMQQMKETGVRSINYNVKLSDLKNVKITYKQLEDPEELSKKYEQVVYSYYFKTSRYERMEEKLKAVKMDNFFQKIYPVMRNGINRDNAYAVGFVSDEHFDTFELEPQTVSNGSLTIQPMVNFKDMSYNDWIEDFVFDVFGGLVPMGLNVKTIPTYSQAQEQLLMFAGHEWYRPEPALSKTAIQALLLNSVLSTLIK